MPLLDLISVIYCNDLSLSLSTRTKVNVP